MYILSCSHTQVRGELVVMTYLVISVVLVILYTYRHLALVFYLKCSLQKYHAKSNELFAEYSFPGSNGTKSYLCKNSKGIIVILPVKRIESELPREVWSVSSLPRLRYFFFSVTIFLLSLFYAGNLLVLSIFFPKTLVKKMLYIFEWFHKTFFKLLFNKWSLELGTNTVLF